jgi:predicted DNA-binding transcriptional regulator AlpA
MDAYDADSAPRYIRGPQLRKRWGNMSNSTFYEKLRKGLIPKPVYPFGPEVPYWVVADIEEVERQAIAAVAA